jgi:hypothetical protein
MGFKSFNNNQEETFKSALGKYPLMRIYDITAKSALGGFSLQYGSRDIVVELEG